MNYLEALADFTTHTTKSGGTVFAGLTFGGNDKPFNLKTSPFCALDKSKLTLFGTSSSQTHSMNLFTRTI